MDFNYDYGQISSRSGRLSGTLTDGTSIFVSFNRKANSSITLVPEPLSIGIAGLGLFLIRVKRK